MRKKKEKKRNLRFSIARGDGLRANVAKTRTSEGKSQCLNVIITSFLVQLLNYNNYGTAQGFYSRRENHSTSLMKNYCLRVSTWDIIMNVIDDRLSTQ